MFGIEDAALPGLADLSQERLRAITGAEEVALLRLRYRPGKRAILHVSARQGGASTEGTLWFFSGDKGKRLGRRNKTTSRFDPSSEVLFESFPHDHRMPQIRRFLAEHRALMPGLTGFAAAAPPRMLRYRPGLSCTFVCPLEGHGPAFVKLVNDDDPVRLAEANGAMQAALAQGDLRVARALGTDPSIGAIAYETAPGRPLDALLSETGGVEPLRRTVADLGHLWAASLAPARRMDANALLDRARESVAFVAVTAPACLPEATAILDRLAAGRPDGPLRPIHGDMKLEHVFLDGARTTLIDTESVSLGLPDYDLAQLYGRLWQAELEGGLPRGLVEEGAAAVRAGAGPAFAWCLDVVAVRLAKFYAQRPGPDTARLISAMLSRLR